jgi:hypothetical protein
VGRTRLPLRGPTARLHLVLDTGRHAPCRRDHDNGRLRLLHHLHRALPAPYLDQAGALQDPLPNLVRRSHPYHPGLPGLVHGHGQGAGVLIQDVSAVAGVTQATGSRQGWMMVLGICTNISSISTQHLRAVRLHAVCAPAARPAAGSDGVVPMGTIVVALIGILCTSCAAQILPEQGGTLLWEPYNLLSAVQEHYGNSPRSRRSRLRESLLRRRAVRHGYPQ